MRVRILFVVLGYLRLSLFFFFLMEDMDIDFIWMFVLDVLGYFFR